jgi:hypothetical protein
MKLYLLIVFLFNKKQELLASLNKMDHVKAYLKEEMPEKYHYKNSVRIGIK